MINENISSSLLLVEQNNVLLGVVICPFTRQHVSHWNILGTWFKMYQYFKVHIIMIVVPGSKDNEGFPLRLRVCAGSQDRLPLRGQGDNMTLCEKNEDLR